MTPDTEQFSIEEFKSFLLLRRNIAFKTDNGCECPLARWLRSKYPNMKVHVRPSRATFKEEATFVSHDTPFWMIKFIVEFDKWEVDAATGKFFKAEYRSGIDALARLAVVETRLQDR